MRKSLSVNFWSVLVWTAMRLCSSGEINQNQFNAISHYLYGLTEDVSMLPSALAAMLVASRRLSSTRSKESSCLARFIGAAKGSYATPADADAFIREERDAWDNPQFR